MRDPQEDDSGVHVGGDAVRHRPASSPATRDAQVRQGSAVPGDAACSSPVRSPCAVLGGSGVLVGAADYAATRSRRSTRA